jgi:hypothetical protein
MNAPDTVTTSMTPMMNLGFTEESMTMTQHILIAAPTSTLNARVVRDTGRDAAGLPSFAPAEPRHLLYQQDQVGLHLHLMLDTERWSTVVVGQILRLDADSVADRPVELLAGDRVVAHTTSNELGEFQLTAAVDGPVALEIRLADGRVVEITVDEMVHELEELPLAV